VLRRLLVVGLAWGTVGVDEVIVSWWGRGSVEGSRLPLVLASARRHGLLVGLHLEPYDGRSPETVADDLTYAASLGIRDVYVYHPHDLAASDWTALRQAAPPTLRLLAGTQLVGFAAAAAFDGIYTYDFLTNHGGTLARLSAQAHALRLVCAPSVGPGYDGRRAGETASRRGRRNGLTYDRLLGADLRTAVNLREMATRAVPAPLAQLPNALTVGRLLLIPVFVALMVQAGESPSWPAGIVFGVAGVTDQVDGFLARRWHVESRFGKIADPLADRLMIDAAVILLVAYGRLPWVGLLVIGARDLLLLVGWRLLAPRGIDIEVNAVGKVATWLLYAGIAFRIVTDNETSWPLWLFWIGVIGAVVAAMLYVRDARKELRR
jgi:CDP-diacylglycerol--glycerol-3-phosphate 3-phosphatidyltransferase